MTIQAEQMRSRRRHKAAPGGRHDRTVRMLAVVLPGLIGALLAVMVLSPLAPRGEISFLLDRTKVAVVQDRLKVVSAMYRGADNKGRTFR
jgi:lipopolysaccharide export system protein LptC